jgi:1-acyl-sn-glycerol-3-phosphate acyltransferase
MQLPSPDPAFLDQSVMRFVTPLMRYHQYSLVGDEHVPRAGRLLLVCSHSFITYDIMLSFFELRRRTGRIVRGLGDDFWFRTRVTSDISQRIGAVRANPQTAQALLEREELVGVAPGGQWEALRPSTERHRLRWQGRRGFARLALLTQTPIVLSTCPAADKVYTVYSSPITEWFYRHLASPLPIIRGVGPTLLPRPVPLTTYLSPLFHPPTPQGDAPTDAEIDQFRDDVQARMEAFMAEAIRRDRG